MMLFDKILEDIEKNGGNEELVREINEALRTGYISNVRFHKVHEISEEIDIIPD